MTLTGRTGRKNRAGKKVLVRNFPLRWSSCLGLIAGVCTRKRQRENKGMEGRREGSAWV